VTDAWIFVIVAAAALIIVAAVLALLTRPHPTSTQCPHELDTSNVKFCQVPYDWQNEQE